MKKIRIISVIVLALMLMMVFSSSVFAGTITSATASMSNNKITVSGTAGSGVLATAIVVYSGDNLVYMETCEVNDDRSFSSVLNHEFTGETYTVKVADYNGGDYVTVQIPNNATDGSEEGQTQNDIAVDVTNNTETSTGLKTANPKTGDNIMIFVAILAVSLVGMGIVVYKKNRKVRK